MKKKFMKERLMKKHQVALLAAVIMTIGTLCGCGGTKAAEIAVNPQETAAASPQTADQAKNSAAPKAEDKAAGDAEKAAEDASAQLPAKEHIEVQTTTGPDGVKLSDDASDFVILSEVVPDAILEIRYYTTYNFIGDRIEGYEEPIALLTEEAAEALKEVSDDLKEEGYRLKIYDAYRPQCAVTMFSTWSKDRDDTRMKEYFYPEVDKSDLNMYGYVAKHSGHSRGSTVDLTLFDMDTEKEVDMGGTFDYFGDESHPDYSGITDEQHENRMILRDAMVRHGFKPISTEWWHFTLKDEPYPDTYFTFPVNSDSVSD